MIKIDLITGFLGSGKTTFIKKYVRYLIEKGYKVGIIENDFGAVNVDMMLLQEDIGDQCDLEMISGGCDKETHRRRFKTKLISMGMLGYDRIIIEPSGIYDVDEFFDSLYEEPLDNWYEIGNVIAIVDAKIDRELSKESLYLLASEVANAGCIILSRCQQATRMQINETIDYINRAMIAVKCQRQFSNEVICKDWNKMKDEDFENILQCGYVSTSYVKMNLDHSQVFTSLYFMNVHMSEERLYDTVKQIMNDETCGRIYRIKGFIQIDQQWMELNATKDDISFHKISIGQEVIIVIGEGLNKKKIEQYWL